MTMRYILFIMILTFALNVFFLNGLGIAGDDNEITVLGSDVVESWFTSEEEYTRYLKTCQKSRAKEEQIDIIKTEASLSTLASSSSSGSSYLPFCDESFQLDILSGRTTADVPLEIPPGRKGIQPNVALYYTSTNSPGWCGIGWNIKLDFIQRSTKNGVPNYNSNDSFVYSLNGSYSDLVNVGSSEYRAKIESQPIKFNFDGTKWIAIDTAGTKYYFGSDYSSTETNSNGTFSWYLDEVVDIHGNYYSITYLKENDKVYPSIINYTGNKNSGLATSTSVEFITDNNSYQTFSFRSGYRQTVTKLLKKVVVKIQGSLVKEYELIYETSDTTSIPLLSEIQAIGSDALNVTLCKINYYQDADDFGVRKGSSRMLISSFYRDIISPEEYPDAPTIMPLFNGECNHYVYVYYPRFNFEYGNPRVGYWRVVDVVSWSWAPLANDFGGPGWLPIIGYFNNQYSARGIVNPQTGEWQIMTSTGAQTWITNFGTGQTPLTGDFNGDGLTDAACFNSSTGEWKVALSNGEAFINPTTWITNFGNNFEPLVNDFNADGVVDIGYFDKSNGEVKVAYSNGREFITPTTWIIGFGVNKDILCPGDFNGDGLIDLGIYNKQNYTFEVAIGDGTMFTQNSSYNVTDFGTFRQRDYLLLFDLDWDGRTDILVDNLGKPNPSPWILTNVYIPDECSYGNEVGKKLIEYPLYETPPNLLSEISAQSGGKTLIYYKRRKCFYDFGSSQYKAYLYPFYLTGKIEVDDAMGNIFTAAMDYGRNFIYDDREFIGFEDVNIDMWQGADVPFSEGGYAKRNSYEFSEDPILKGKATKIIEYKYNDSNQGARKEVINQWDHLERNPGVNFVYLTQTDTATYDVFDLGDEVSTSTSSTFEYDNYGNITSVHAYGDLTDSTDDKITQTEYMYNTTDWILSCPKKTTLYDYANNKISEVRFYYDYSTSIDFPPQKGLLTKQEAHLNLPTEKWLSSTSQYDTYGNIIQTTDPKGNSITTEYDTVLHQYPKKITNMLGHTQQFTYDYSTGQLLTSTDPNGKTTTNEYDSLGRLIKVWGPLDTDGYASIIYEYDLSNVPNRLTKKVKTDYEVNNYIATHTFTDGFGRVIEVKSPTELDPSSGASRQVISGVVTYDYASRVKEEYQPYFEYSLSSGYSAPDTTVPKTTYEYDCLGRIKRVVTKNNASDEIEAANTYYGFHTVSTDFKGNQKDSYSDAYGRLIQVAEHNDGNTYNTYYEYDTQGNLKKTTDNAGNITTISYDSLGRKLSMNDPDMGTWTYAYDDNGNLLSQTDAKGQTITFIYDALNRLTQKQTPDSVVTYIYDQGVNGLGRLNRIDYNGGSTEFFYDGIGREIKTIKTVDGAPYQIERTYDALDRLKTLKYPTQDGEQLTYAYDTSGAVKSITGLSQSYVSDIDYNASGQMTSLTHGNGTTTTYAYNTYTKRLANLLTQTPQKTLQNLSYQFDDIGNVLQIDDTVNTATQAFQYDTLYRLKTAANSQGYGTITYDYDPIGNLIQKGTRYFNYGEGSAGPHALTSSTDGQIHCTYDVNGNMLTKNDTTYEYDSENRLKKAEKSSSAVHDTFNIPLKSGWNFITLPVVPDGYDINDDMPISAVLSSLTFGVDYDQVTKYDTATHTFKSYCNNPVYNQFDKMKYLHGYQIYCLRDCTLTTTGSSPSTSYGIQLPAGYNLVGVDITNNGKAASAAFFNISYSQVKWYNPNSQSLEDVSAGDTVEMGRAYYVNCTSTSAYSVSALQNITTFTYDGDGGRVKKYSSLEGTTIYIGSLFEKTSGITTRHIFLGDTRICSVTSTGDYSFYHPDHLGSTSDITDKNGNLIQHTEYSPYGEFSPTPKTFGDVSDYLFTGKLLDTSTDLYYYGARYYDPELGRFTQADTIIPSPANPQSFNRYSYCDNNPINYTDPTGHSSWSKFWHKVEDVFKEKVIPAAISFIIAASITIATGGMGTPWVMAGLAASATTLTLDTGEGRQLIDRVGNEFFDDALGMSPSLAHTFSSVATYAAVNWGYNAGLNALYHPHGPPGVGKSAGDGTKDRALSVDKGKAASGNPIIDDPAVKAGIEKAWAESGDNGIEIHEQAGWIRRLRNGTFKVDGWPQGKAGSIRIPGVVPRDAIANFHTHPYASYEVFIHGPSRADYRAARTLLYGQRNFIVDRQGIMEYFPSEGPYDPSAGSFKDIVRW